jgi:hypothetical protein
MRDLLLMGAVLLAGTLPAQAQVRDQSVGEAVQTPLRDLRIKDQKIPPVLQLAASAPYSLDGTRSCATIAAAVRDLDGALGADADTPSAKRGEGAAVAAAGSRALVGTLIPGFGLVRMVTGADKAQRRVEAAVYAGAIRRAYLKGLGQARGCKPPSAPNAQARAAKPQLPADKDDD